MQTFCCLLQHGLQVCQASQIMFLRDLTPESLPYRNMHDIISAGTKPMHDTHARSCSMATDANSCTRELQC
jgi:hypothetical protein